MTQLTSAAIFQIPFQNIDKELYTLLDSKTLLYQIKTNSVVME